MLNIGFVFEDAAGCVDSECEEQVLNWDGQAGDDRGMVSEVVGRVSHEVDKIHPPKLE